MIEHAPTRAAALVRLTDFTPRAGIAYARHRNVDVAKVPTVSALSPWLRHRVLTEAELLRAVLDAHGPDDAGKFVQEVFWRTYWKGWMELRPSVWDGYRAQVRHGRDRIATEDGLRSGWEDACRGETGIDAFDAWARQLVATGWLHNHARMSFASIWVFTLRLPWALGADFFLRHLLDGDPAVNTLNWRWVAGIQTAGKPYLVTADAIEACTDGRFRPEGLATDAPLPDAPPTPDPGPAPTDESFDPAVPTGLLLTEEDLSPDWLFDRGLAPLASATFTAQAGRSPWEVAPMVHDFTRGIVADCVDREAHRLGPVTRDPDGIAGIVDWARDAGLSQVVLGHPPVGPVADALSSLGAALAAQDIALIRPVRDYDTAAWPLATRGYFRFRKAIPELLSKL